LGGNRAIPAKALGHLTVLQKLQTLNLAKCANLGTESLTSLVRLTDLVKLDISHCDFRPSALYHLTNLQKLKVLRVAGCKRLSGTELCPLTRKLALCHLDVVEIHLLTHDDIVQLKARVDHLIYDQHNYLV